MKELFKNVFKFNQFIAIIFCSCNFSSDYSKDLSNECFLRYEGKELCDILCNSSTESEIPANIIKYYYDENYILAIQKPKKNPDVLYNKEYNYPNGLDSVYYWIVINKQNKFIGPLNKNDFEKILKFNSISNKIEWLIP